MRAESRRTTLLQCAIGLLARREHSRLELARKLERRLVEGEDRADIDAVLDDLERRQLLSEERFAAAIVRARASRYGEARLASELKHRGVPADVARGALDAVRESELERARAQWARRFKALPATLEERAQQIRFLEARGFSATVIRQLLRATLDSSDDA